MRVECTGLFANKFAPTESVSSVGATGFALPRDARLASVMRFTASASR